MFPDTLPKLIIKVFPFPVLHIQEKNHIQNEFFSGWGKGLIINFCQILRENDLSMTILLLFNNYLGRGSYLLLLGYATVPEATIMIPLYNIFITMYL